MDLIRKLIARPHIILASALSGTIPAVAYEYGINPMPTLELDSYEADISPAHRFEFFVAAGELETYQAIIRYPQEFLFNGFDTLGPVNTPIGNYQLDLDFDQQADVTVDLLSLNPNSAYADVIPDQAFSPGLEPLLNVDGNTDLRLTLPYGGDVNPTTLVAPWGAAVTLVLFEGVLSNPASGGSYSIDARLTSVDPDTGSFDDAANQNPLNFELALTLEITGNAEPSEAPFERFTVQRARIYQSPRQQRDRFWVYGRFSLGADSDGINLADEAVTVQFAGFNQTLSSGSFRRHGKHWFYFSRSSGIKHLWVYDNGRFSVRASRFELGDIDLVQPVSFSLLLGDDIGQTAIPFNQHGYYRP